MCRLPTLTPGKASGPAGSQPFALSPSGIEEFLALGVWDGSAEPVVPDDAVLVGLPNDIDFFPDVDDVMGSDASSSGGLCQEAGLLLAEQDPEPQVGTAYPAAPEPVQAQQQHSHRPAPPAVNTLGVPFVTADVSTSFMPGLACAVQQQQQQYTNLLAPKDEHVVSKHKNGFGAPRSRRHKSPEEVQAQQERIKKRRRESAQRSRARKNSYVHNMEAENHTLKLENERLRAMLRQLEAAAAEGPV